MGKSRVLFLFKELGAFTLDSDEIVADLLEEKKVVSTLIKMLGVDVIGPGGRINKRAVAEKIFRDHKLRKSLQAFIHPLVLKTVSKRIRGVRNRKKIAVIEVPLLYEGGYQNMFQQVITVYTTQKTALSRLRAKGIQRKEAIARMRAQLPIREKRKKADFAINNNGTLEQTKRQVENIYLSLLNLSAALRDRHRRQV